MSFDRIECRLRRMQDTLHDIRSYVRATIRLQVILLCFLGVMAILCLVQMARLYGAVQEMDRSLHGRFDQFEASMYSSFDRIEQKMDALPMQLRAIADDIRSEFGDARNH